MSKKLGEPPDAKKSGKCDDFESVARRLECDEDKAAFEKKLRKLTKPSKANKPNS